MNKRKLGLIAIIATIVGGAGYATYAKFNSQ